MSLIAERCGGLWDATGKKRDHFIPQCMLELTYRVVSFSEHTEFGCERPVGVRERGAEWRGDCLLFGAQRASRGFVWEKGRKEPRAAKQF